MSQHHYQNTFIHTNTPAYFRHNVSDEEKKVYHAANKWLQDTQYNDTQHNDTLPNETEHNDIQHSNYYSTTVSIMALDTTTCYAECRLFLVPQISALC